MQTRTTASSTSQETTVHQNLSPNTITLRLSRPPARVTRTIRQAEGTMRVEWTDGTIDNEHMNKKKSKKCCIFKKKREFDESSDESDWEEQQRMKEQNNDTSEPHTPGDHSACNHTHHHTHHHQ